VNATTSTRHLGRDVLSTLTEAGHDHAPENSGRDGFEIHQPKRGDHVLVGATFDGVLRGMGTPGVRRSVFYRLENTLTTAGFMVRRFELNQVPYGLIVARDEDAIGHGLLLLLAAHDRAAEVHR
jgi:hypothetical protein